MRQIIILGVLATTLTCMAMPATAAFTGTPASMSAGTGATPVPRRALLSGLRTATAWRRAMSAMSCGFSQQQCAHDQRSDKTPRCSNRCNELQP